MTNPPALMKALGPTAVQEPPAHAETTGPTAENKTAAEAGSRFRPKPVQSLTEAGLTPEMVDAIIFKYLHMTGSATGARIASTLALPHLIVVERLMELKQHQLLGYVGSTNMGDFTYTLTEAGRERARKYLEESLYVGTAPVPLKAYNEAIKAQSITNEQPDAQTLHEAFGDLLVNDQMLATLGPAINSGRGMFLYGFPGNGKTSIAERITQCFGSEVCIPHTLHVDGFLIKLFDPEIHQQIPTPHNTLFKSDQIDERWVKIRRPTIIAGGELTMDALEVRYNATTRISEASMQLKSNLGTLVIDDFGRQRMNPFELLNRWIVPLEHRYDFLALANGQKIQVPFDQLLIFATNLEPRDLVDEAFLRRIPYKINVVDPTEDEFRELFRMMCRDLEIEYREEAVSYLIEEYYHRTGRPFRCCQPRDLLTIIKNQSKYSGEPLRLCRESIDFATKVYFAVM